MTPELKLLLEHCLDYIKHHHATDDGGIHINLIARLKDALEQQPAEQVKS